MRAQTHGDTTSKSGGAPPDSRGGECATPASREPAFSLSEVIAEVEADPDFAAYQERERERREAEVLAAAPWPLKAKVVCGAIALAAAGAIAWLGIGAAFAAVLIAIPLGLLVFVVKLAIESTWGGRKGRGP